MGLNLMAATLIAPTDKIYHQHEIVSRFGEGFWNEVVKMMVATSEYTWHQTEVMWGDAIAYLLARATMENPNDPLVINLLPDQMWHLFLSHSNEYLSFSVAIAGTYLHHDPAPVPDFVNSQEDTARTIAIFRRYGIAYHPNLWADWDNFAPVVCGAAQTVPTLPR